MSLSHDILRRTLTREFRYYQRVGSTNDLAKAWLLEGAAAGAVVIADAQIAGRGRSQRAWRTPAGAALALSVILKPRTEDLVLATMIGALGVYDLARRVGCGEVGIKWPNDVQAAGRKLGGILVENVWQGERLMGAVLGIGVNVRVDFAGTELSELAVSLEDLAGARLERAALIAMLLERVDCWRQQAADEIFRAWRERLNMLGGRVNVNGIVGRAADVAADGALLVADDAGAVHRVYAGDVADDAANWSRA